MPKFPQTQLPALVTMLAFAGATGGCSFQHHDAAKTDNPAAQRPMTDAAAELRAQNELLANSVALMSALAVVEATSALLPPVMAGGGAPAPALTAVPAPVPAEPQIVYVPVPAAAEAPPPTIVNNYYVQPVPEPAPAQNAPAEQPAQVVYVGGGFGQPGFGNPAQGTRGQAAPARGAAAPAGQILSSGSMVARALPLDSGAMVARGNGLTAPPNTSGLLFTPGAGNTTTTTTTSGTQRGGRAGGG